jgi:hypothetical protein
MTPAYESGASAFDLDCSAIPLPATPAQNWDVLAFAIQHQERTNWCWAAVAASVSRFYNPSSAFTQCSIASGELRRDCVCSGDIPDPDPCNVYGYLMSSLFRVGHFAKWIARRPATFVQIRCEIESTRPMCARIVWDGRGAHLVAISGYTDEGGGGLAIADPWWGLSDIDFEDFPNGYINCGSCTDNYYTTR